MLRSSLPHRAVRLALVAVALAALAGVMSRDASAAKPKSCARQVIADWYDDGRVDKIYPLHCYVEAIKLLGTDAQDYTNAEEEIGRAYAYAKLGQQDPGKGGPPVPPTTTSTGTTQTDTTKTDTTKTTTTKTTTTKTDTTETGTTLTDTTTDTSGPSAVPLPLLLLGGVAVLLLAAGSAGYLRRRMNGGDGDDGGLPPDSV